MYCLLWLPPLLPQPLLCQLLLLRLLQEPFQRLCCWG
jgi:hypothetical protein